MKSKLVMLILATVGYWTMNCALSNRSENNRIISAEIVRYEIMRADSLIKSMDNAENTYYDQWRELSFIVPFIENNELRAKAQLLRLLCLQRLVESWVNKPFAPRREALLEIVPDYFFYEEFESNRWFLRTQKFWELYDKVKDLPIAEDIVWEAVNNPGPEFHRCEGNLECTLRALSEAVGKYISKYPDGKYVPMACEWIISFCENVQKGVFKNSVASEEDKYGGIEKAYDQLHAILMKSGGRFAMNAANMLENTFKSSKSTPYVRATIETNSQREQDDDKYVDLIETTKWLLTTKDNDFSDYVHYWRELGTVIPLIKGRELAARAKLMRYKCLARALRFGDGEYEKTKPPNYDEWVNEVKDYVNIEVSDIFISPRLKGEKRIIVNPELLWKMHNEYHDLPIAEEFAWEAANIPVSVGYGPEFQFKLAELDYKVSRYLQLYPDGKYASIAIEEIRSFCRMCLGEDPLKGKPQNMKLDADTRKKIAGMREVLGMIVKKSACLRAKEVLALLEKTFGIESAGTKNKY